MIANAASIAGVTRKLFGLRKARFGVKVALFPFWFLSFLAPQRSLLGNSANLPRQVTTFQIQTDPLPKGFSV